MVNYWLCWLSLTLIKLALLTGCVIGAVGGLVNIGNEMLLLAIMFVPASLFLGCDMVWQILVPLRGGEGYIHSKPSDTPIYMGLAPPTRVARELAARGEGIIWI